MYPYSPKSVLCPLSSLTSKHQSEYNGTDGRSGAACRLANCLLAIATGFVLIVGTSLPAHASGPVISAINPTSAPIGGPVILGGTGFGSAQGSSTVTINGVAATIIESWNTTEIVVEVPVGATTGNVVVTVGGVKSAGKKLTVISAPAVTSASPSSGSIGTSVTLSGTNLDPQAGIAPSFLAFYPAGGCPFCASYTSFADISDTSLQVNVPPGAVTGEVAVAWDDVFGTPVPFTVSGVLAPLAVAGLTDVVPLGSTVRLDGTHSYDLNGLPLTYQWSFSLIPTGSQASLVNPTSPMPTFVPDVAGQYEISLVVNNGTQSSPSTYASGVFIFASTTNDDFAIANAGPDQTVQVGSTVHLDGSGSMNPSGDALTYNWCLYYSPNNSSQLAYEGVSGSYQPDSGQSDICRQ
jgi:hypothetical protein